MKRERNSMGQFIDKESSNFVTLYLPGRPILLFKFLLIALILAPWIAIIFNRINFKYFLEFLFVSKLDEREQKKQMVFFDLN